MALPVRAEAQRQFMRQLSDADLWKAVFPTFDRGTGLPEGAPVCTGEVLFSSPRLQGGRARRSWPFQPDPQDLVFGSGPRRTKIVWFKTHEWDDGTKGGVIAMVRAEEDFAEVYGIGAFRGSERSRFSTERIGGTLVLTAVDDQCTGKAVDESCESEIVLLMPWKGQLVEQARIATERRLVGAEGEPGAIGPVTYRMTGTPVYEPTRVRLLEQIQVADSAGRKLRQVELERRFDFVEGKLVERERGLWDRVVGASNETAGGNSANSGVAEPPSAEGVGSDKSGSPVSSAKRGANPSAGKSSSH